MEHVADVIIAVLAFAGTLAGSLIASSKSQAVMQEQVNGVKDDILKLSARVDKHNSLVERMAVAESKIEFLEHREGL